MTKKERQAIKQAAKDIFSKYSPDEIPLNVGFLPPVRMAVAELKDGAAIEDVMESMTYSLMAEYFPEEYKAQEQQEIEEAAKAAAAMPKPKPEVLPSTVMPEGYREGGRVKLI